MICKWVILLIIFLSPTLHAAQTKQINHCYRLMSGFIDRFYPYLKDAPVYIDDIQGLGNLLLKSGGNREQALEINSQIERMILTLRYREGAPGDASRRLLSLLTHPQTIFFLATKAQVERDNEVGKIEMLPNGLGLTDPFLKRQNLIMDKLGKPLHPAIRDFANKIEDDPEKTELPLRLSALFPPFTRPLDGIAGILPAVFTQILQQGDLELIDEWEKSNLMLPFEKQDWLFKSEFIKQTEWGPFVEPAFLAVFNASRYLSMMPFILRTPRDEDLIEYRLALGRTAMSTVGNMLRYRASKGYDTLDIVKKLKLTAYNILDFGDDIVQLMKKTIKNARASTSIPNDHGLKNRGQEWKTSPNYR